MPSRFTVDTKNAGPGDLSVAVEGPSKVDIDCVDNGDGTCDVTYVPVEPGESFMNKIILSNKHCILCILRVVPIMLFESSLFYTPIS